MISKLTKWLTIGAASAPLLSYAQFLRYGRTGTGGQAAPVQRFEDVLVILDRFIGWFQAIIFVVAIIFILVAAFKYVSGGPEKVGDALNYIIYAAVGIGVALLAFAVRPIVQQLLGA